MTTPADHHLTTAEALDKLAVTDPAEDDALTPDRLARLMHAAHQRISGTTAVPSFDQLDPAERNRYRLIAAELLPNLPSECACQTTEQATHYLGDEAFCAVTGGASVTT